MPISAPSGEFAEQIQAAADTYAFYVKVQAEQLVSATDAFAAAYLAGDDDRARELYAPTRMHWERIEPVCGVLRRPRPETGPARSGPGTGSGLDRLAPYREGSVAGWLYGSA